MQATLLYSVGVFNLALSYVQKFPENKHLLWITSFFGGVKWDLWN